jgi:hypothetical protein
MKKNTRNTESPTRSTKFRKSDQVTIGMDVGDKTSRYCALNKAGVGTHSLVTIRVRAALVESRTQLVDAARGLTKPLVEIVESLTEKIKECDWKIEQTAPDRHPETKLLRQVSGVGPQIALPAQAAGAGGARHYGAAGAGHGLFLLISL